MALRESHRDRYKKKRCQPMFKQAIKEEAEVRINIPILKTCRVVVNCYQKRCSRRKVNLSPIKSVSKKDKFCPFPVFVSSTSISESKACFFCERIFNASLFF